jgi:hypothetical protein
MLVYLWWGHTVVVVTHDVFDGLACSALDAAGCHLEANDHVHVSRSLRSSCSSRHGSSSSNGVRDVHQRQKWQGGASEHVISSSRIHT